MKTKKILCFLILPLFFYTPAFGYIEKDSAVVRVMNKAAGKTQTVSVAVGKSVQYDDLTITARSCKQSDPFDPANFFAFIEVYTKTNERIFSGWMNRNEPGQNPLQDDAFDIWLEKCE